MIFILLCIYAKLFDIYVIANVLSCLEIVTINRAFFSLAVSVSILLLTLAFLYIVESGINYLVFG